MARKKESEGQGCLVLLVLAGVVMAWSYHWTLGVLSLCLIGYLLYRSGTAQARKSQRQLQDIAQRYAILDATRHMSGVEFEELMAQFFRSIGYKAQMTKASGDQGVDLMLQKGGRRIAVQLKRYSKPVGNKAVQEALSGMMFYKTQEAWVVTTSSFTKAAVELANGTGVRLIDGLELGGWIKGITTQTLPGGGLPETTLKRGTPVYGELASVKEVVDLSPRELLDSAQKFLIRQGYRVKMRSSNSLTVIRHQPNHRAEESAVNLTMIAQQQPRGGVRVTVRGNDQHGVQRQKTAWTQWADSLPKI